MLHRCLVSQGKMYDIHVMHATRSANIEARMEGNDIFLSRLDVKTVLAIPLLKLPPLPAVPYHNQCRVSRL